jgi:hypothetical protein
VLPLVKKAGYSLGSRSAERFRDRPSRSRLSIRPRRVPEKQLFLVLQAAARDERAGHIDRLFVLGDVDDLAFHVHHKRGAVGDADLSFNTPYVLDNSRMWSESMGKVAPVL